MAGGGGGGSSFKSMKLSARAKQAQMEQEEDVEMVESASAVTVKPVSGLMLDKVYLSMLETCLILEDFTQLPSIRQHNGQLYFLASQQTGSKRSLTDVVDAR